MVVRDRFRKDRRIRQEPDQTAVLGRIAGADLFQRRDRLPAVFKADKEDLALFVNRDFQPFAQRVDDRGADAVQTAGNFIGPAAELPAGMQHCKNRFDR